MSVARCYNIKLINSRVNDVALRYSNPVRQMRPRGCGTRISSIWPQYRLSWQRPTEQAQNECRIGHPVPYLCSTNAGNVVRLVQITCLEVASLKCFAK